MGFPRPTLTQLRQSARAFFQARLPGADSSLRRSNIGVTADLVAGLVNGQYGYIDWIAAQLFIDTAEGDYLDRWAQIYGLARAPAVASSGNAIFTGISGTVIPASTLMQDSTGLEFETTAEGTIQGGTVTLPIAAVVGGTAGNLGANAPLTLEIALGGVDADATVDVNGLAGGTDIETDTSLRRRLLARIQQPPHAGTPNDYVEWALKVPGVTRAWSYPLNRGLGTTDVTFVIDGRADILPSPAEVAAVQAYIDSVRPVTDDCVVFAAVGQAVDYTISGLLPSTGAMQAAIQAALDDLHATLAIPGGGLSFQDQIVPALATAIGVQKFTLTAPAADIAGAAGVLLTRGALTFV